MDNSNSSEQVLGRIAGSLFLRRNLLLGIILVSALIGFEAFNYSTTFTALNDLLGDMRFAGIRWATILALAFSSIDFAGFARMFTDDQGESAGKEVWFLFVAWLLAATINAMLTWWGVSLALVNHTMASTNMVDPGVLMRAVPIFVAIMVWVTRILLISAIASSGSRFLAPTDAAAYANPAPAMNAVSRRTVAAPASRPQVAAPRPSAERAVIPARPTATPSPARADSRPAEPRTADARPANANGNHRPATAAPTNGNRPNANTSTPGNGSRPSANTSAPKPLPERPPARPQRQQPPMPEPPPIEEEDTGVDEPEYIPDPSYLPAQSPFHSLSARGARNNGTPRN